MTAIITLALYVTAGGKLARRSVYTIAEAFNAPVADIRKAVTTLKRDPEAVVRLIATVAAQTGRQVTVTLAPVSEAEIDLDALEAGAERAEQERSEVAIAPEPARKARKGGNPHRHPVTGKFLSRSQVDALRELALL